MNVGGYFTSDINTRLRVGFKHGKIYLLCVCLNCEASHEEEHEVEIELDKDDQNKLLRYLETHTDKKEEK